MGNDNKQKLLNLVYKGQQNSAVYITRPKLGLLRDPVSGRNFIPGFVERTKNYSMNYVSK